MTVQVALGTALPPLLLLFLASSSPLSPLHAANLLFSGSITCTAISACSALPPSLFVHPSVNPSRSPTSALLPPLPPFIILFFSVILFSMPVPLSSPHLSPPTSPALSSPRLLHNRCVCNASQVGRHDEAALETERESQEKGHAHTRTQARGCITPTDGHARIPIQAIASQRCSAKTELIPTATQPPERTQ